MINMNTEKLADILRGMLNAVPKDGEFTTATTEPKEFGGDWFHVSHESGPEYSVAAMDRDSVVGASMQTLQRFAELAGLVITNTAIMAMLVDEQYFTDDQVSELLVLADDLGVVAK